MDLPEPRGDEELWTLGKEAPSSGIEAKPLDIRKAFIEVTTRCNLRCSMCVKSAYPAPEGDMDPGLYERILAQMPDLSFLGLSGIGEPLLHPRIVEFVRLARKRLPDRTVIGFNSNGVLVDEPLARSLAESGLDKIALSIDSVDVATYGSIRRGGTFDRALAGMDILAEWIRRGLGAYAWLREAPVTEGLDRLRRQLGEAERALGESPKPGEGLEGALARLEELRNQLERLTDEMRRSGQSRPGEARGGERDQAGAPSPADQPGSPQGGQTPGPGDRWAGGFQYGGTGPFRSFSAMNTGERLPPEFGLAPPATDARAFEQAYRQGLRDLRELRQALADRPELASDVQELIRQIERLDPKRFPGNPALIEQLRMQLLPTLEHVELRLRRELDGSAETQARSGPAQPVPPGYAEAVAEYYRKLSRSR